MSNARRKREAAQEHNAMRWRKAHRREAQALFDWLTALGGKHKRSIFPHRRVALIGSAVGLAIAMDEIEREKGNE